MSDVIFDHTDIRDVVSQEENGMLVRLGGLDGFSGAVKRLLLDTDLYKALSPMGPCGSGVNTKSIFLQKGLNRFGNKC